MFVVPLQLRIPWKFLHHKINYNYVNQSFYEINKSGEGILSLTMLFFVMDVKTKT